MARGLSLQVPSTIIVRYRFMKKTYKKTTNEIYVVFFHLYIVYVANVSDLIHTHFISNKRYIPNEMRKDRPRSVLSSLFGFHENLVSICSYVTKKKKCVNLLSTVHYTKHCEGKAMKPEVILFYNETKAGVDCLDIFYYKKVNKTMGCCVFLQRVDTMALAAFCICKEVDGLNKNIARRNFLTTLADTLVLQNIENRMNNIHIINQFNTRLAMESNVTKCKFD